MKESLENFIRELESFQKNRGLLIKPQSQSLKKERNELASFFISLLWEEMFEWIKSNETVFGLSITDKNELIAMHPDSLFDEMKGLYERSKDFPPAKLRSYATKLSEYFTRNFIEKIKKSHLTKFKKYEDLLSQDNLYWFRRNPEEHLQTGMHTAISANFKMISVGGSLAEKQKLSFEEGLKHIEKALDAAHYLSTCHMTILHATDGALWDSAGFKEPTNWHIEESDDSLYLSDKEVAKVKTFLTEAQPKFFNEERTGCPALYAKTPSNSRVTREVKEWCLNISKKFYLPLIWREPAAVP